MISFVLAILIVVIGGVSGYFAGKVLDRVDDDVHGAPVVAMMSTVAAAYVVFALASLYWAIWVAAIGIVLVGHANRVEIKSEARLAA